MYPPRSKKQVQKEKGNRIIYDRNVRKHTFRKSWSQNKPWLKYIQEENKIHYITCRETAEVDKSINNNLNNLMTIKIEEFDPIPAIEHWNVAGIRRLQK